MSETTKGPVAVFIEDDAQIRRFVKSALESEGWRVFEATTLKQGLTTAATRQPDLVVLDLGLPDGNGVDFITEFRGWSPVPIIVLSARAEETDKIEALDAGADDYLTKPFGVGELLARVRVAERRRAQAGGTKDSVYRCDDVTVDLAARRVEKHGEPVHLTRIEYRLLCVLIANAGRVLTHRQLLREVWGPSHVEDTHYLRVHMGRLRQKLEDDPAQPRFLLTETAVGYRLLAP